MESEVKATNTVHKMVSLNYNKPKSLLKFKVKNIPLYPKVKKDGSAIKVQHRVPMCNRPVILFNDLPENVRQVINLVSERTKIEVSDIMGTSRKAEFVSARHLSVHFCYLFLTESEVMVGKWFNRDHSTIYNADYRVRAYRDTNRKYAKMYNELHSELTIKFENVIKIPRPYNLG